MGRPRKYANDAEKMRVYRASRSIKCADLGAQTAATIEKLALMLDVSESAVIANLCKFALLNRNWEVLGLIPFRKRDARRGADTETE